MSCNRRQFLSWLAAGAIVSPVIARATANTRSLLQPDQDIILGGGQALDGANTQFVLSLVNLQQQRHQLIALDFLAHGAILDPANQHRLLVFEKIGPGAAEIDLDTFTMSRKITTDKARLFYGHGAFSRSGDNVYCTETYIENHRGIINVRDSRDMQILGEFPTYGENPHECQLLDDGTTLVVANAGSATQSGSIPSVTYIDSRNQQLLERVTLTNNQLNTGHLAIGGDGALVVASAPAEGLKKTDKGGVSIRNSKQAMLSMVEPRAVVNRMTGEALSVIIDDASGTAAVTHPDGNMVTFWSTANRQLLRVINLKRPRGVTLTLDGKAFIISHGKDTRISLVDVNKLRSRHSGLAEPSWLSGSHIYNWSRLRS